MDNLKIEQQKATENDNNDENQPLLQDSTLTTLSLFDDTSKQSVSSCIFNFVNSCLGSGVLAVPYVFKLCGYILGPLISLTFCCLVIVTFFFLLRVAEETNRFQFNTLADHLWRGKTMGIIAAAAQMLFIAGCLISYVIVIRDNFWFFDLKTDIIYADIVLTAIMLFIVMPICYLKTLDKLKFNSYLVLIVMMYIDIVLFCYFVSKQESHSLPKTYAFENKVTILNGLSLTIQSYNAHYNFLNLVYELKDRRKNAPKVIFGTMAIVFSVYLTVGLFGYLQYGDQTQPDILSSITTENSVFSVLCNAFMILLMICHIPLPVYAMRRSIESFIYKKNEVPTDKMRYILASSIVVGATIIGILIPSIDMVLDFTGSLAGGFQGFIFPCMAYASCMRQLKNNRGKILGICCAIFGVILTCVAFGAAIWKWGWNHGQI